MNTLSLFGDDRQPVLTRLEPPSPTYTCRHCGSKIRFMKTNTAHWIPVEADSTDPNDGNYREGKHDLHSNHCDERRVKK